MHLRATKWGLEAPEVPTPYQPTPQSPTPQFSMSRVNSCSFASTTSCCPIPPPFPLGRERGSEQFGSLPRRYHLTEHCAAKEVSSLRSCAPPFPLRLLGELSALGRRAELHQPSVKVASATENGSACDSGFCFWLLPFLDQTQTGLKPRLGLGLYEVSV